MDESTSKPEPIPYGRQSIDEDDIAAVEGVLRGDWLTTGPAVRDFEAALCAATGASHTIAVSNGTAALHTAYAAAGLGPGDVLLTCPITYAATANAAAVLGAEVRFVDVHPETGLMDIDALDEAAQREGERVRVITPIDFAGTPADYPGVRRVANKVGATVVADAAHSLGATLDGVPVGRLADMTTMSFHPVKIITTGEGGAVLTNDDRLAAIAARFRSHGMTHDPALMRAPDTGGWHYEMLELGLNYRLTDIHAALGTSQLGKLDRFIARRREIAAHYTNALAGLPGIELPPPDGAARSSWHLYVIRLPGPAERRALYDALRAEGILVQVHYEPVHLHPWWRKRGCGEGLCPQAERFGSRCLSLPIYPAMTDEMLGRCVDVVCSCAERLL